MELAQALGVEEFMRTAQAHGHEPDLQDHRDRLLVGGEPHSRHTRPTVTVAQCLSDGEVLAPPDPSIGNL